MVDVSIVTLIIGLIAVGYAGYLSFKILKVKPGSEKMQQISEAIREGAMAFMKRQYKTIAIFAAIIAAILWFLFDGAVASGFILGAFL